MWYILNSIGCCLNQSSTWQKIQEILLERVQIEQFSHCWKCNIYCFLKIWSLFRVLSRKAPGLANQTPLSSLKVFHLKFEISPLRVSLKGRGKKQTDWNLMQTSSFYFHLISLLSRNVIDNKEIAFFPLGWYILTGVNAKLRVCQASEWLMPAVSSWKHQPLL